MKGLRGLFRLGTLTLLALTLTVALVVPSAADSHVCSSSQMLEEVEIVSVEAKQARVVWGTQDLVNFKNDLGIENGLLEVKFKDLTDTGGLDNFDGYIIEAVPGDDDPGDSNRLEVKPYKSETLIPRPLIVGSTITEPLDLEPGTKYYVTVYAVNHNTVQISPSQRAQDSNNSRATTFLSAPFPGALEWGYMKDVLVTGTTSSDGSTPPVLTFAPTIGDNASLTQCDTESAASATGATCRPYHGGAVVPSATNQKPTLSNGRVQACAALGATCAVVWQLVDLDDDDYQGTHFSLYGAVGEDGQHYFRWLNPADYGPFDHILDKKDNKQADMLSMDKDGNVDDHCADDDINGDCGHTHYQFKAWTKTVTPWPVNWWRQGASSLLPVKTSSRRCLPPRKVI